MARLTPELIDFVSRTCDDCMLRIDGGDMAAELIEQGHTNEFNSLIEDGCNGMVTEPGEGPLVTKYCPIMKTITLSEDIGAQ